MKLFRLASIVTLALLAFGLRDGARASAQGQPGDSHTTALYIDSQPHAIRARSSIWFRFDYDATNLPSITLQLINGAGSGMRFDVWTADAIADIANNQPLGRGTAFAIACPPDSPTQSGCQTRNLIWTGIFLTSQTGFVEVINDNTAPAIATLTIQGAGVSVTPAANATDSATSPVTANQDDPGKAAYLDSLPHQLAAGAAVWYRFDYDATDRPVRTVRLLNGNGSGLRFEVWTPDRLNNWWENKPVGRGTVYLLDCESHEESETGECQSPDLKWMGKFIISWTVYVRVVNGNGFPTMFTLTLK